MTDQISIMQLPLAGALSKDAVIAVSQHGEDGEPDTFGVTVESLLEGAGGGGEVAISDATGNLLTLRGDGLAVMASHKIIPKVYAMTFSTSKSALTKQSLPDGAVIYRGTFNAKNPMGTVSLGGVGIFTTYSPQSSYFYLGKNNEFVSLQIFANPKSTTSSTITTNIVLVFSAEPYRAFDVYTGDEKQSVTEGDPSISIGIRLIAGTTMSQNGFD